MLPYTSVIYFLWALPTAAVALAMLSGKLKVTHAALLGVFAAVPVAWLTGPAPLDLPVAFARGGWIGLTIAPYIFGGLLFWQVAGRSAGAAAGALAAAPGAASLHARRRQLFFACYLVGPFAESATGFGVGMLGTMALLARHGLSARHLMVFGLLSQTLIPWGAMGSGTLLAAAYARLDPALLALHALVPVALLMLVWLPLFWRTGRAAGYAPRLRDALDDIGWMALAIALLALATWALGPETALLTAFAPLIVLRYLLDNRPSRAQLAATAQRALPFAALIACLMAMRLLPAFDGLLAPMLRLQPFADLPALAPFKHAGLWMVFGALATLLATRRLASLRQEAASAWAHGKNAIYSVFLFSMLAEILASSGISPAAADALARNLGSLAVLISPLVSGALGILANSGNAPNGLFMPSQMALALQSGLNAPAVAAVQHVAATSLGIFSPVRMSIAAGLAKGTGQERSVYGLLLPYALCCVLLLALCAGATLVLH